MNADRICILIVLVAVLYALFWNVYLFYLGW